MLSHHVVESPYCRLPILVIVYVPVGHAKLEIGQEGEWLSNLTRYCNGINEHGIVMEKMKYSEHATGLELSLEFGVKIDNDED